MNTWVVVNKISQLTNSLDFVSSWSVPLSIIQIYLFDLKLIIGFWCILVLYFRALGRNCKYSQVYIVNLKL